MTHVYYLGILFTVLFSVSVRILFISSGSMDSVLRGYSKLIFNTTKLVFFFVLQKTKPFSFFKNIHNGNLRQNVFLCV